MINRRIKFRHIQCFVEIHRQKSLKRAAEQLFLTQPAVSKTLAELEEIVGAALMLRTRAGISLTKQGEVFLHFAGMSLAALQQGLDGIDQIGRRGDINLSVGALPSVAAQLLPAVAMEFSALAPDIVLEIIDGPHGFLTEQLRAGALDIVIGRMGSADAMKGLSFTQLYSEHVEFVVRADHPLLTAPDIARIVDWPVIFPSQAAAIYPLVERFLIANGVGDIPQRITSVSGAFGRIHTRNSDAIWIISAGVVAMDINEGRLMRLPFDTSLTKGPVGMTTRPELIPGPGLEVFGIAVRNAVKSLNL
jgi:LysR family pca operon transcriptional activator